MEIIYLLLAVEASLPITINRHHVKSHAYDKVTDPSNIPLPNLINKRCDLFAEEAYILTPPPSLSFPILPTTKIYITIDNISYSDNIKQQLQFAHKDSLL